MEVSHLNLVDLAVFGVILLSGLLALFRGFVRELLSLGAWIGAVLATVYFYPVLRPWMHTHVKSDFAATGLTALTLFCVALAILIPIGFLISGLVRGRALTAIDRSIGFVFGLARGALVVCLLFLITLWVWPEAKKEPQMLAEARTRPFMAVGAEELKRFLPKEDIDKMDNRMQALDKEMGSPPSLEMMTTPSISGFKPVETTTSGSPAPVTPAAASTTAAPAEKVSPPMLPTPPPIPPPPPSKP